MTKWMLLLAILLPGCTVKHAPSWTPGHIPKAQQKAFVKAYWAKGVNGLVKNGYPEAKAYSGTWDTWKWVFHDARAIPCGVGTAAAYSGCIWVKKRQIHIIRRSPWTIMHEAQHAILWD
jgi:hypothetical protein